MNENNDTAATATIDPNVLPRLTIEEFRALSPEQKRTEIAKDALAQIAAGRFLAKKGMYFQLFADLNYPETKTQAGQYQNLELRDVIAQVDGCRVCAMGACFASAVRLDDNLKFQVEDGYYHRRTTGNQTSDFNGKLTEFFDDRQLELIEAAFELNPDYADHYDIGQEWDESEAAWRTEEEIEDGDEEGFAYSRGDAEDIQKLADAIDFGRAYENETERMEAILTSIASHPEGLFVP